MTCIVAFKTNDKIYMGSDSQWISGNSITPIDTPRMFFREFDHKKMLIGTSATPSYSNLMLDIELPNINKKEDFLKYLRQNVCTQLRNYAYEYGLTVVEGGETMVSGELLIGFEGELYIIDGTITPHHIDSNIYSIGFGLYEAIGAMEILSELSDITPEEKINRALTISAKYNVGVDGPFVVESI